MFVLQSTYDRLEAEHVATIRAYRRLNDKWTSLVTTINEKGGERFLTHGKIVDGSQFTVEDINRLLSLCHPDKHDGKRVATEMTQRLLALRKDLS